MMEARRCCPRALVVPPRFGASRVIRRSRGRHACLLALLADGRAASRRARGGPARRRERARRAEHRVRAHVAHDVSAYEDIETGLRDEADSRAAGAAARPRHTRRARQPQAHRLSRADAAVQARRTERRERRALGGGATALADLWRPRPVSLVGIAAFDLDERGDASGAHAAEPRALPLDLGDGAEKLAA